MTRALPIFQPYLERPPLPNTRINELRHLFDPYSDPNMYIGGITCSHIAEGFLNEESSLVPSVDLPQTLVIKSFQIYSALQVNLLKRNQVWSQDEYPPQMFDAALKEVQLVGLIPEPVHG